jgi:pimeloyl-ACP methyl ester carboxylesterase
MTRALLRALCGAVLTIVAVHGAAAEEVQTRLNGLTLDGNLEFAPGKAPEEGVMLLVHGTLAHNKMELIANLQRLLAARGVSTLAVNLSLGVNDRHGFFDCGRLHTHRYGDAIEEIDAWVGWLKSQGVLDITVAGHSRGAAQVAAYALQQRDPAIGAVVLLAPTTFDAARTAEAYQARYGVDLAELVKRAQSLVSAGRGGEWLPGVGFLNCDNATVTAASFVSYYGASTAMHTPALMTRLRQRTLVVVAGADALFPDLAAAVAPLDGTREISVKTVEGADHFFLDLFAEDASDVIAAFLTR